MMLLKTGTVFGGRYEIVRVVSAGGMGVVYEVLHRDTQRKRAMKIMLPSLLADDDMRARFAREAIVTANIESEHLVEVFDAGVDAETSCPFLVMEMLRGEDLGARLTRHERTSPQEVLQIFDQLTRALSRTHEAGIVHRDLKPENVFVTRRDDGTLRIKILDFGIAKLIDRSTKNTRSVGTPLYMAPEQMTGKGIGPASDLYALAQIAFTLLVGAPYFQQEAEVAENVLGLMTSVSRGTIDPATKRGESLGVHLPAAFDGWFAKATHVDVASRYASARQQLDALHGVLDGAPDQLPVSSGEKRRAAAFGATEAMMDVAAPARPEADAQRPLAPAVVDRSAAPARTHLSAAGESSGGERGATTAGPSSRTLAHDGASPARTRSVGLAIAAGVVAVAAVAIGVVVKDPAAPTGVAASGDRVVPPAAATSVASPPSEPPPSAQPQVSPAPGEPSPPPAPPAASAEAAAPSASASAKPAAPSGKGPPRGPAPASSPAAPPSPPPSSSTPAPPAGTVWSGPRR